ncbi:MAG: hypothetical protein HY010_13285 [Acidobacteria bacterium]|nr:hypothetical protein [Acidobacteriota bacterium]
MKQAMKRTLTSLLLFVVYSAGNVLAQSTAVIKVNIPFEFSLGDRTFQPGDYSLTQPMQHFLVLRDARGQTVASTFTNEIESSSAPATSKLRFYSVGGRHELIEVWQQNASEGHHIYPANANHRLFVARHRSSESREAAEGTKP